MEKRGRPVNKSRAVQRALFDTWSDRTFARYWKATQALVAMVGYEQAKVIVHSYARPNGTLNVAAILEHALDMAAVRLISDRRRT
jgi:hypothetical protein